MKLPIVVALAALGVSAAASGAEPGATRPRQRVIRTWKDTVKIGEREVARRVEVVFDYEDGVARELSYDGSGRLLHSVVITVPVRPSDEEMAEAERIVRADPLVGRIMQRTGARPHGMFTLEQREGQPCGPRTRCLQVMVASRDGYGLVRRVVVDLMRQRVVDRSYVPEEQVK